MNIDNDHICLPDTHKQATVALTASYVPSLITIFPVEAEEEGHGYTPLKTFKKKALLIGVQDGYEWEDGAQGVSPLPVKFPGNGLQRIRTKPEEQQWDRLNALRDPHHDVRSMRQLLIDVYKYAPEDVVMLIDDDKPEQKQPTRENILDEIQKLVKDAKEHDCFYFHFSGQLTQEVTDDIKEEDGKNEFIFTSDGEKIKDDELRATLSMPLPVGSKLTAVLDSFHRISLLNLKHFRHNPVYVPWMNTLWNGNRSDLADMSLRGSGNFPRNPPSFKTPIDGVTFTSAHDCLPNHTKVSTGDSIHARVLSVVTDPSNPVSGSPTFLDSSRQCDSPVASGSYWRRSSTCEENPKADMICISSEQNDQISLGKSLTQAIVDILRKNPHPTLSELMTLITDPPEPDTTTFITPYHRPNIHSEFMPTQPDTQSNGKHPSTWRHRPETASVSVLAGAQGAVINGGTFIATNSLQVDSAANFLPYSLLAFQTALGAINTHSHCPGIEKPPPFDLVVPYRTSLPIYYEDLPILLSPLAFMYLWRLIFGHYPLNLNTG